MIGCGLESIENTIGQTIETEPDVIRTLVEGNLTDEHNIHVKWNALVAYNETRGSPILSYHLRWDNHSFGLEWFELVGLTTNYTATNFTFSTNVIPGNTYQI